MSGQPSAQRGSAGEAVVRASQGPVIERHRVYAMPEYLSTH